MSENYDVGCPECGAILGDPQTQEAAEQTKENINSGESDCGACGFGGEFVVVNAGGGGA